MAETLTYGQMLPYRLYALPIEESSVSRVAKPFADLLWSFHLHKVVSEFPVSQFIICVLKHWGEAL